MKILNGYYPHKSQNSFHESTAKFRALITGVGYGKSAAGANEILKLALQYPKSRHLILAPTAKIMTFATLAQFWKFCPKEIVADHHKSNNTIFLKNGAQIIYLTADNERHVDRLRGIEIGSFWCDEARLFPSYVWEVILTRLRDKYGPLKGIVTTTPRGYDWLYYYFVKKQHPRTKEYFTKPEDYAWWGGSTLENPHLPEEYKENLMNQLSGSFKRQEVFGSFESFEGMVYSNFSHKTHIIEKVPELSKFKQFIVGNDWGFTNAAGILIIGLDHDNRAYVLEEFYEKRQDIEVVGNWLLSKKETYPELGTIYGDPSEPMFITKWNNMGLNVVKANNEIMPGINFVHSMFEVQADGNPRLYISNKCPHLIDEINAYRYADRKEGKEQKETPIKENDHLMDALRYALFSHLGNQQEFMFLGDGGKFF